MLKRGWGTMAAAMALALLMGTFVFPGHAAAVKETSRCGSLVAYDNGTVKDTATNLMWAAADNGAGFLSWDQAVSYCTGYSGGGYAGWRMPTQSDLTSLKSNLCGNLVHTTSGTGIWTSQVDPQVAGNRGMFNFSTGYFWWYDKFNGGHALPVRNYN
jgi:hypothetical protein